MSVKQLPLLVEFTTLIRSYSQKANEYDIITSPERSPESTGLKFMLDVGLYQLDQQAACQRYRQTTIDATKTASSWIDQVTATIRSRALAPTFA